MFKLVFSAVFCAALCLSTTLFAQDCGCCEAPTRKRIKIEQVDVQVPRLERQCVTDDCGCQRSKFVRSCATVQRPKLTVIDVPVDPCEQRVGLLARLRSRMGSAGDCCAAPEPAPCGCEAAPEPEPCGCDAAPEPAPAEADCGCGGGDAVPMGEAMEMSAPAEMSYPTETAPIVAPIEAQASEAVQAVEG